MSFPIEFTTGIEVRNLANRGNTAFATMDFNIGDTVHCEGPALIIKSGKGVVDPGLAPFKKFAHQCEEDDEIWGMLRPASLLSVDALNTLKAGLYSPLTFVASFLEGESAEGIPTDSVGMPMSTREAARCEALFTCQQDTFETFFPTTVPSYEYWASVRDRFLQADNHRAKLLISFEVLRFLHACRVNYHAHESTGLTCIFPLCCKLSHHCNPNTFWRMVSHQAEGGAQQIRCAHIASRPISKGEELSFSYCGTGINMLADTSRRRDALHPLGFVCRCHRCTSLDEGKETSRSLKCLACGAMGAVTMQMVTNKWACRQCPFAILPENFVDGGLVLTIETVLEHLVLMLMYKDVKASTNTLLSRAARHNALGPALASVHSSPNPLVRRWLLVGHVKELLGPDHFLFPVAVLGLLRALNTAVSTQAALADFIGFVADRRKQTQSSSSTSSNSQVTVWIDTLFSDWVPRTEQWFITNMLNGMQHYLFWGLVGDICRAIETKKPIALNQTEINAAANAISHAPAAVLDAIEKLRPFEECKN